MWIIIIKNIVNIYLCTPNAEIAQLVEHDLAKVGVASSSLVFRSKGQFTADLFSCPNLPKESRTLAGIIAKNGW